MTTFTTEDRVEMEKLLREQTPRDFIVQSVVDPEPIPFVGWVQHSDDTVTREIQRQGEPGSGD